MNGVSRATYKAMPDTDKLNVLFDCAAETHDRLQRLENTQLWYKGLSAVMGFVGGITAVCAKAIFFK